MPGNDTISADQMRLVLDVARLLAVTSDLGLLLRRIAEAATSLLGAERASIFLHDPARKQLWTKVALGAGGEIRVPDDAGIVGHVFQINQLLNIPCAYDDPRFNRGVDRKTGFVTSNLLTCPMDDLDRKPIGVIQAVNKCGGVFLPTDEVMLELLADQAGVAIQRYQLQQKVIENVELRREMDLAKKVQDALIPKNPPRMPGFEAVGWTLPASVTGGDCFDLWRMPGGELGIFLADASGHGLAPALVVSQARTLLRALAEINCTPRWLLERVNARLSEDLEADRFVTAFAGCLSPDGKLQWWSAGQGPVFIRPDPAGPLQVLQPCCPPVGVMPDYADADPEPDPVWMAPGGMLAVLSDGIFEARSPEKEFFGVERATTMLDDCVGRPPGEVIACFRQSLKEFQGKEEPADDQTMVIVQRAR